MQVTMLVQIEVQVQVEVQRAHFHKKAGTFSEIKAGKKQAKFLFVKKKRALKSCFKNFFEIFSVLLYLLVHQNKMCFFC